MTKSISGRRAVWALVTVVLALTVFSCASVPPKPPVPSQAPSAVPSPVPTPGPTLVPSPVTEPAPQTTPAPTPSPAAPAPGALAPEAFQRAQDAIDEAVAAGAEKYSADLLAEARQALGSAKAQSDPPQAKVLVQTAVDKAHAARDAALAAQAKAKLDSLDQEAQKAIAGAEAVDADQYAPALLNQARQALTDARVKGPTDPVTAVGLYQDAAAKGNSAKAEALAARTKALVGKLDQAAGSWKALQPDKWVPDTAGTLGPQVDAARAAVLADYDQGLPLAEAALKALGDATSSLDSRLKELQDLRTQVQKAMADAEAADADVWVPDLVQEANDSFFLGTSAWKKFKLDDAGDAWKTALFQAQSAAAKAQGELQRKQTETLMLETMKKLEDASGKTVVDPQDNIISPQPWDGKKQLRQLAPSATPTPQPLSIAIPADGSPVVLGDKQRVTYLDEAKDQWAQGVRAYNSGDLTLANEAFIQAQKLIDSYLSMAVDKVYTVRLNPEHRDSLWRIAGNGEIYDTPWEWPKIWKRNQKLIQNPDLIYPGWQLIIPPQ